MSLGILVPTGVRTVASSVCSSILAESQVADPDHHSNHGDVRYKRQYMRSYPEVWELGDFVLVGKKRKPAIKANAASATTNSTLYS